MAARDRSLLRYSFWVDSVPGRAGCRSLAMRFSFLCAAVFSLSIFNCFYSVTPLQAQAPNASIAKNSAELRIVDRAGLTRFSAQIRNTEMLEASITGGEVEAILTHVDGLSAPVRGRRLNEKVFRFDQVPPGTWRISVMTAGTDQEDTRARVLMIKAGQ